MPSVQDHYFRKKKYRYRTIVRKTINQIRRTNYIFNLSYYYETDIFSFQLFMEEFLKEPLRYALNQLK